VGGETHVLEEFERFERFEEFERFEGVPAARTFRIPDQFILKMGVVYSVY
jgi:hypothetical protein